MRWSRRRRRWSRRSKRWSVVKEKQEKEAFMVKVVKKEKEVFKVKVKKVEMVKVVRRTLMTVSMSDW